MKNTGKATFTGGILTDINGKGSLTRTMLLLGVAIIVFPIMLVWCWLSISKGVAQEFGTGQIAAVVLPFVLKWASKWLEMSEKGKLPALPQPPVALIQNYLPKIKYLLKHGATWEAIAQQFDLDPKTAQEQYETILAFAETFFDEAKETEKKTKGDTDA